MLSDVLVFLQQLVAGKAWGQVHVTLRDGRIVSVGFQQTWTPDGPPPRPLEVKPEGFSAVV